MAGDKPVSARAGSRRSRWPLHALGFALALLSLSALDASRRVRASEAAAHPATQAALGQLLGFSDLALSSSSRWLRNPTQVEPGAAAADAPAILDTDPAGALIAPQPSLLGQSARDLQRVPHPTEQTP